MNGRKKSQIVCPDLTSCKVIESTVNNILVPYDGSNFSERAFSFALDLAYNYGSTITTLTIIYENPTNALDIQHQTSVDKEKVKKMEKTFKLFKDASKKFGVPIKNDISRSTEILESILSYIISHKIDLIVMGSRSRLGPKRYMIGSIALGICKSAPCPVLLIK